MKKILIFLLVCLSFSLIAGELEDKLKEAIVHRNITKIRELLLSGAKIDDKGRDGVSPIIFAIKQGYSDIAMYMIKNGPFYPEGEGVNDKKTREDLFCWANCRNIEAAISLYNYTATDDDVIKLEYDNRNFHYKERKLDDKTLKKLKKYLPGRKLPKYPKDCVYFLYPEEPIDKLSDNPPKIGVYCKNHGLPGIGYDAKKSKPYKKSDIWF